MKHFFLISLFSLSSPLSAMQEEKTLNEMEFIVVDRDIATMVENLPTSIHSGDVRRLITLTVLRTLPIRRFLEGRFTPPKTRLCGHKAPVTCATFTPDGKHLVTGSVDKTAKLWELATSKCLHTFEGHSAELKKVIVTADGKQFVSTSEDGTAILWDLEEKILVKILGDKAKNIGTCAISSANHQWLTIRREGNERAQQIGTRTVLQTWDIAGPKIKWRRKLKETQQIKIWDLSPNGTLFGYAQKPLIKVYHLQKKELLCKLPGDIAGLCFNKQGTLVVCTPVPTWDGQNRTVTVWHLESACCLQEITLDELKPNHAIFTGQDDELLAIITDATCTIVSLSSGARLHTLEHTEHIRQVQTCGRFLLTADDKATLHVWDPYDGRCLYSLTSCATVYNPLFLCSGSAGVVMSEKDNCVNVWDIGYLDRYLPQAGLEQLCLFYTLRIFECYRERLIERTRQGKKVYGKNKEEINPAELRYPLAENVFYQNIFTSLGDTPIKKALEDLTY